MVGRATGNVAEGSARLARRRKRLELQLGTTVTILLPVMSIMSMLLSMTSVLSVCRRAQAVCGCGGNGRAAIQRLWALQLAHSHRRIAQHAAVDERVSCRRE